MSALSPAEWDALALSLRVALWCVAVVAVPGVAMGWLLARVDFRGKSIVDAIVHLPLVVPPVVVGYLLLVTLGRHGVLGGLLDRLGIPIVFTWKAAVVASAIMGFPLMVRGARLAFEMVDPHLEDAARTLGASPVRVWRSVTLPLAMPGVFMGLVLAFARSLGEFGATIMVAGNIPGLTRTMPLAIYTHVQSPGGDADAARLVVVSIILSLAALIVAESWGRRLRRRLGLS